MRTVYMDHSATTPIKPEVLEKMTQTLRDLYGNPSSIYEVGQRAKVCMEEARGHLASLIGADPSEIYFTSSGTEADNWAVHIAKRQSPESTSSRLPLSIMPSCIPWEQPRKKAMM